MKQDYRITEHYEMWLDDGIIHVIYSKNLNINIDVATTMVFDRFKISHGRDWPVIVKLNNVGTIDEESRDFLSKAGIKFISRLAIIATDNMDKLISEVWITLNKPHIPTRIFDKQCQGLKWLNRYQLRISA